MSSVKEFPTDVTARSNILTSGPRRANRVAADCPADMFYRAAMNEVHANVQC